MSESAGTSQLFSGTGLQFFHQNRVKPQVVDRGEADNLLSA